MTDKPKFKQTEVGMIPSDWEVKTLGELVDMSSGTTPSRFNEKNFQGNVCWLSSGELKSHYIYNTKEKISEDAASSMRLYPKGTVVIAMYGLEAEGVRGTSSILAKECTISQACMAFSNLREINNEYFYYWYAANGNEIGTKYAQGTKQQNLSPEVMKNVIIPLPPTIEEQQRIANALSDVDTLIANLEKLIAKKKNIKQGAMQQLLTGKKRLPGFGSDERTGSRPTDERRKECHSERSAKREESSGYKMTELGMIPSDWEFEIFGKLVSIYRGGSPRPIEAYITTNPSGINWIKIGDVDEGAKYITSTQERIIPEGKSRSREVHKGDFILSNSMSFGRPYILKVDGCIHDGWLTIQEYQDTFDTDFLYYMLSSEVVFNQYVSMAAGSSVQNLNKEKVAAVKLFYPPSKTEQTAIANVLSDMDTEISALETKLAKYRTLKTGMMQQLLTGKIRLADAAENILQNQNKHSVPLSFKRSVLAAEIADRLCEEPTFGHVKMEKMLFLTEKMCNIDIDSSYHRDAAGPFDNRGLHSIDSQLAKQKWFQAIKQDKGYRYVPLEKRGGHKQYFDRYFADRLSVFDNIINIFKAASTEQCEIIATLYSAWEDFLKQGISPTDEQIVTEVLTNWHESKKRISKDRWMKALLWMKEHEFIPNEN